MADLAEVRERLATVQRFEGYSGTAAIASGLVALVAGVVQAVVAPQPHDPRALHAYLAIWLGCLAVALGINYGAIMAWRARHAGHQASAQIRTVGWSIAPAIAAGGVVTAALSARSLYDLLPGMWCATYALGIFASRAMVPRNVVFVAASFGIAAALLLLVPGVDPLAWWIMPLAFGLGNVAIGAIVRADARPRLSLTGAADLERNPTR